MRFLLVSATTNSSKEETDLWKSFKEHDYYVNTQFVTNNKQGLCSVYNKFIDDVSYDTIIFAHDDIVIDSVNFIERVEKELETADVIGVAGGGDPKKSLRAIDTSKHMLWHHMVPKEEFSGIVFHPHNWVGQTVDVPSLFGPRPKEVLLLDGVFLAVNAKRLREKNIRFDEKIEGFHHYDIKFCLDCHLKGLTLKTCDINIIHKSPGLKEYTDDFMKTSKYVRDFINAGISVGI